MLETIGLVRSTKAGRVRTFQLAPERLKVAEDWLAKQRSVWEQRFDQLDDYPVQLHQQQKP